MNHSQLLKDLNNPEYRRGFVEGHAKDTIAFQVRQLRKAEDWDQKKLAEVAFGNPNLQPMVSRYENPDYGKYSISTLLELAFVFDVALIVRFAPYSELVEWDISSTERTLRPAKYSEDKGLSRIAAAQRRESRATAEIGAMGAMSRKTANSAIGSSLSGMKRTSSEAPAIKALA